VLLASCSNVVTCFVTLSMLLFRRQIEFERSVKTAANFTVTDKAVVVWSVRATCVIVFPFSTDLRRSSGRSNGVCRHVVSVRIPGEIVLLFFSFESRFLFEPLISASLFCEFFQLQEVRSPRCKRDPYRTFQRPARNRSPTRTCG